MFFHSTVNQTLCLSMRMCVCVCFHWMLCSLYLKHRKSKLLPLCQTFSFTHKAFARLLDLVQNNNICGDKIILLNVILKLSNCSIDQWLSYKSVFKKGKVTLA